MKITIPKDPRDVPNVREIEDVLLVICQKAGLRPETISFAVAGGDRRRDFAQQGVKLLSVSSNAMGVPMYVGCEKETVEGHLTCSERPKAMEFHGRLLGAFGNKKVHTVDNRRIRSAREFFENNSTGQGLRKPAQAAKTPPSPSTVALDPPKETAADHLTKTSGSDVPAPEKSASASNTQDAAQLTEADDPSSSLVRNFKSLHLALVAFAGQFQVNQPFGFAAFEQILKGEIHLSCLTVKPYIRVFTDAGFLIRLNPGRSPARYAVTELCIQTATATDAEAMRLIAEHLKRPEKPAKGEMEEKLEPKQSLLEQVQVLRQSADEYQKLLHGIETRSAELAKLQTRNLENEEQDIKGQTLSHEKRLRQLQEALKEINRARERIRKLEEEIQEMRECSSKGHLAKAHEELQKLKGLLGQ